MSSLSQVSRWKLSFLLALLIFTAVIFWRWPKPCQETITYRIGKVDRRFGLERQEFASAVQMAAAMWGKPLAREIFREDNRGVIEVNLIYDYRQEAADKLKKLNYQIDNTKNSYEALKARLETLQAEYGQVSSALAKDADLYNMRISILNANVEYWNRNRTGGIPDNVYKKLAQEKEELDLWREKLKIQQESVRQLAETINSMVVVVNAIATNINIDLLDYQQAGDVLGREFCEGIYENKNGVQTINIYQFDNDYRLVRVLAHELGHALGLNHSTDPHAVMYRLIQSDLLTLSPSDIAALLERCANN